MFKLINYIVNTIRAGCSSVCGLVYKKVKLIMVQSYGCMTLAGSQCVSLSIMSCMGGIKSFFGPLHI